MKSKKTRKETIKQIRVISTLKRFYFIFIFLWVDCLTKPPHCNVEKSSVAHSRSGKNIDFVRFTDIETYRQCYRCFVIIVMVLVMVFHRLQWVELVGLLRKTHRIHFIYFVVKLHEFNVRPQ